MIGVVTVHDGPPLPEGEIIAPTVGADAADAGASTTISRIREEFLARRRLPRPAAPGAGRRHLLHQPPVRHRRAHPQDGHRGRHGRRRGVLYRPQGRRHLRRRVPPRRAGRARAAAASGASRCCPANTPSTHIAGKIVIRADHQLHPEVDIRPKPVRIISTRTSRRSRSSPRTRSSRRCRSRW